MIGTNTVHDAMEKVQLIRDRLKTIQSCLKSYADVRRRELEFQVDDWVFLKVSPMKGVMRFRKKWKLSPRYIGPYKILKKVGKVAYELELQKELATTHPVFHISLLKKCVGGPASIVPLESVDVKDSLTLMALRMLDHPHTFSIVKCERLDALLLDLLATLTQKPLYQSFSKSYNGLHIWD